MKKNQLIYGVLIIFLGMTFYTLNLEPNLQEDIAKQTSFTPKEELSEITAKQIKSKQPMSERKKKVKGYLGKDNPGLFAEWMNGIRTRPGQSAPDYKMNYQMDELLKAKGLSSAKGLSKTSAVNALDWQERGPGNVAGRTRGILVYPGDPDYDTWFVGSVGGGVWKTTDAGQTWMHLTADLPNLATSTLAWSAANPSIIYVGTGEGFGNVDQIDGSGIWKSTDAGMTWTQLTSTSTNPDFENVMRMAVDPADPDIIVAAVAPGFNYLGVVPSSGIYRSTDGGTSWTKTYDAGANNVEDLRANPLNFNTQYATVSATTVIKSVDGGQTWFESANGIGPVGRMELTIAPSDTNRIYISAQGGAIGSILYSSDDGGANWFGHVDSGGNDAHWLGGQGWYDNTIAVNPYDEDQVFVGGIQLWQLDVEVAIDTSDFQITGVDQENTSSFLSLVNWGGRYAGGGLDLGSLFLGADSVSAEDYSTVEVRFGNGKTQKAYRFVRDADGNFLYQDYVDVPFEVWDTDNNMQLMVSFRDSEDNGTFDLEDRATAGLDREYTFINAVPYSTTADTNIAKDNGMIWKNTYAYWPEAPAGTGSIDFASINVDAVIRINWGTFFTKGLMTTNVTDGYGQFGGSSKGVHVDHHNIVLVPTDSATQSFRFLNGNDGGVAFSDDKGASFSQTGEFGRGDAPNEVLLGYNTTQFYGVDKANGVDRYIGGMQDNGSWFSGEDPGPTSEWTSAPSGDGYEASWHYNDVNKMIETSQFNGIYRTTDGGTNWTYVGGLVDNGSGSAPFFTKIAKSKQDPDLVFAIGASGVWRSDDFGASWTLTPMTDAGWNGTSSFSQIKISLNNPQIVWTARNMTATSTPYVSTDGGLTFTPTNIYTDVTLGRISGLETHPSEDSTAFALLSMRGTPKILKTMDLGQTWEELSGFGTNSTSSNGFPDVSVFSLLVMPYNTDIIWAGTEIGIFESTDGGANWAIADNGFPSVAAYDMVIVNDEIVVATHGRGVWTVSMTELDGYEPPAAVLSPRFAEIGGGAGGIVNASVLLPSAYDSSFVVIDGQNFINFPENMDASDTSLTLVIPVNGLDTLSVSVLAFKDGAEYKSAGNPIIVFPLLTAQQTYSNSIDDSVDVSDFVSSGLAYDMPAGFTSGALHSPHAYPDASNLTVTLKVPIVVAGSDATLIYDDIALVEPGNDGTVFGDATFWDFVIVEGSKDNGATWLPLVDGYDARNDAAWLDAFNNSTPGDSTMYRTQVVDLLQTFSAGDEVLVRFRLFADANTNGWGWAIDNISIQEPMVGVDDDNAVPKVFDLAQNYPNPFNPSTTINFSVPKNTEVELKVFDALGAEVETLIRKNYKPGNYNVLWNAANYASGVYFYRIKAGDFVSTKKLVLLK